MTEAASMTQEIPKELSDFARKLYSAGNKIASLEYKIDQMEKREQMLMEMLKMALEKS